MMTATARPMDEESTGGRLVTVDGESLPLRGVRLTTRAQGGIARTVLEQIFENPSPDPLRVTYQFPLPHDGAVSGFAFRIGDRRVIGEVDRRGAARERFEEAIASGRTAGIVDQERGSLFTQELGNVPPGARIVAELTVDQRLAWLPWGAWEWRFPTVVAPRYQGAAGRVADAGQARVDVAGAPLQVRHGLALRIEDALAGGRSAESPSHAVRSRPASGAVEVSLSDEGGAPLDRDVVVRWPVAAPGVGVTLEIFRAEAGALAGDAYGLLTLVPPAPDGNPARFPRDLVVLLDTSGSMEGDPLAQALRVVSALVDALGDEDTLELIAFSTAPQRWQAGPVHATAEARRSARAWLAALRASGGTEMRSAIVEALRGLREEAQRQVLLVTDGLIGFEHEIVRELLRRLPAGSRLHALGVGSAVNRSLTGPAARAGRGTESIVGLGEDVERAVATLAARTAAPIVTGLAISGDALLEHAPARLPDLFGAGPALVALRLRPGGGTLRVTGKTPSGAFERAVTVPACEPGSGDAAVAALFGREAVEDLETLLAAGEREREIDQAVEKLGLAHQIATRLTSWVAVSEEPAVDPTRPTRRARMPQQLPYGMSVEGLGLRPAVRMSHAASSHLGGLRSQIRRSAGVLFEEDSSEDFGSMLEQIGDTKFRRAVEDGARPGSVRFPEPPAPTSVPPPLRGFVVLERAGELVVEVRLDADLDWSPPERGVVVLGNGKRPRVTVDLQRTTAAGRLAAGQVLRIVLRHPGKLAFGARLVALVLGRGGTAVEISIERNEAPAGGAAGP